MTLIKDIKVWFDAMGTLPWTVRVWAILYPLPQIIGGLIFILTIPGALIFFGRVLSGIIQSQVHKRAPFSKLMGPVGHAHWLLIVPYLGYVLATQDLSPVLYGFICWVIVTTLISTVIDVIELSIYLRQGHVEYKR